MDPNHGGDLNPGPRGYALSGKVMLISTVVLFAVVLLLLFLHLYLRSRFHHRRRRRRRHHRLGRRLVFAVDGALPSSAAAHHGLDPAALKFLPVLVFAAAADGEENGKEDVVECAVCLNEFEEGEKVRTLPRCGHRFHIECIDTWFHSHATCPLCRSAVEAPPAPLLPTAAHQVLPPVPSPPEPGRPSPADLCAECWGEDGIGSSASSSASRGLRIEAPGRGSEGGELGLGLKSPGSRMLLLTRLLSRDSRVCRGGGTAAEPDLERGEGAATGPPPPPSPPRSAL